MMTRLTFDSSSMSSLFGIEVACTTEHIDVRPVLTSYLGSSVGSMTVRCADGTTAVIPASFFKKDGCLKANKLAEYKSLVKGGK